MHAFTVLAAFALAAPLPKDEPLNPEVVSPRQADLLRDSRVQRELGLSAEHRVALLDFFEEWDEQRSDYLSGLNGPNPAPPVPNPALEELKKKQAVEFLTKHKAKQREAVAAHLTATQHGRLKQIERRYLSLFAYQLPGVAAELKLTAEQIAAIRKVATEYRAKYDEEYAQGRRPSGVSPFGLAQPSLKTIDGLLTEAQRTKMTALFGPEPKLATTGTLKARATLTHAVRESPEFFPR